MPQEMGVRGIQGGLPGAARQSQSQEIQRQVGAQEAEFTRGPCPGERGEAWC